METNGTTYYDDTPKAVYMALERVRASHSRIRLWYGDTTSGKAWAEENDVCGYVGRSMGPVKVPLLIANSNSLGGGAILDHCIVRIDTTTGTTLYRHPSFDAGEWVYAELTALELRAHANKDVPHRVYHDGMEHACFATEQQARRYIEFMTGKRYAK